MKKHHSYLVKSAKWVQSILRSLLILVKLSNIFLILLMMSIISTTVKITATIAPSVHASETTNRETSVVVPSNESLKFFYTVERSLLKDGKLEEKDCSMEDEHKKIERRNFLYLSKKCHIGMVLLTDLFNRGIGTILHLTYYILEEEPTVNNQATKPTIDKYKEQIVCPPVCATCYKILTIIYPNLARNKDVKCSEKGCEGAPDASFSR